MRLSSVDNWNFRFHSPATVLREEGKGLEMKNSFHRQLLCPISPHDDSSQTIKFVIMERAGKMKRFSCFENSFTEISFARLVYDRKSFLRGQLFIYVSAFHSTSFLWKFSRISRHLQGEITSSWLRIRKLCEASSGWNFISSCAWKWVIWHVEPCTLQWSVLETIYKPQIVIPQLLLIFLLCWLKEECTNMMLVALSSSRSERYEMRLLAAKQSKNIFVFHFFVVFPPVLHLVLLLLVLFFHSVSTSCSSSGNKKHIN